MLDSTPRLNPICFLSPLLSTIVDFKAPFNISGKAISVGSNI